MIVKTCISIVLSLALTLTPALAKSHALDVPGPSLIVLETTAGAALALEDGTLGFIVLEASPSHLVLATAEPGVLVVNSPEEAKATVTRVRVVERDVYLDGARVVARSLYGIPPVAKEEDHDIDPDPKRVDKRPLVTLLTLDDAVVTKEEDHDIDPDPKRRATWAGDWALVSAAIAEFGPGWYFVVRGGEVSTEVLVEGR